MLNKDRAQPLETGIQQPERAERPVAGWTLLEVMIALAILTIGVISFLMALTSSMRLSAGTHESDIAKSAAREMLERMRDAPFPELFALYNTNVNDDPDGSGTAPGANFAVAGLEALPGDADGKVGQIIFPESGGSLQENMTAGEYGLPRNLDMNGDGDMTDSLTEDYIILPVTIRLQWTGVAGEWLFELKAFIADR